MKILNLAFTLLAGFCIATVISLLLMGIYLASAWQIDGARWKKILAVAQGQELPAAKSEESKKEEEIVEQASFAQVLERRALKYRDLELRERELKNRLSESLFQEAKLAEAEKKFRFAKANLETQLDTLSNETAVQGQDEVRRTLETVKPRQAKELIAGMLEKNQMEDVVLLLTPMPDSKRSKIFSEFKTPEELEKLSEILEKIREGKPKATIADSTRKQLDAIKQ